VGGGIGTEIAGYRIESEVGRGGMGVVYLAEQASPKRRVALKILTPNLANDPTFRERFQRESDAAASIEHPNIVPIYGAGESDGQLYLAMRYVQGTDLGTLITRERSLQPDRAARICAQVANALAAAHEHGVVHRDVKPGNVLVDANDHAYLSDFGLVRRIEIQTGITKTGQLTGTVDYVAPEQIRGEPVDGRADLYSLGCVLYECLTGDPPFRRETEVATLYAHLESPSPRPSDRVPSIPRELDDIAVKATAKAPERRFRTGGEMASALASGVSAEAARPPGRRWGVAGAIVGALVVAVVAVIVLVSDGGPEPPDNGTPGSAGTIPANSLIQIDPSNEEVIGSPLPVPDSFGTSAHAVAFGEGGVWVLEPATLTHIDPVHSETVETLTGFNQTGDSSMDLGFRTVWIGTASDILRVDPITTNFLRPVRLDPTATSIEVAVGAGSVWGASSRGELFEIDPATLVRVGEPLEVGVNASGLAAGFGGIWVLDNLASSLTKVDVATLGVDPSIELPGELVDVEAGEGSVWVLDERGGVVYRINPETGELGRPIRVGSEPSDLAIGLDAVWVTNRGDGTISRIDHVTEDVETIEVGAPVAAIDVDERNDTLWIVVTEYETSSH
jgi:serine/threonine protein kinase